MKRKKIGFIKEEDNVDEKVYCIHPKSKKC